jgi:hypothetical protein
VVDSRQKGARTELKVRELLRDYTDLNWERVPASGALDEKHGLKGDLYIPGEKNRYCVEVKGYADDHLTSQILTSKSPTLIDWWEQTLRESLQVKRDPLLFFKFDRSKIFVAFETMPSSDQYHYIYINRVPHQFYVSLAEDWLFHESIEFTA